MRYFKNTELAKLHHISEKSVRNWIHSAQEGKLDLQLHRHNGRSYVANTTKNSVLIQELVQRGKKYKNTRGLKAVTPTKEFYEVYEHHQILDLISNLTIHSELPLKYTYLNGGADYWDQYAHRLADEAAPNLLNRTVELLDVNASCIDKILEGRKKVNVVDLGPGNGLPIRQTLERLIEQEILGRYIAIDISQEILDILEKNIKKWFGETVRYEGHIRDFSYERFDDLFAEEQSDSEGNVATNLVLILGGTLHNFRSPASALRAINNSLGARDILIYSGLLDNLKTRQHFDVTVPPPEYKLSPKHKFVWDFMSIDETFYDVEHVFSERKLKRAILVRPKVDISVTFSLRTGPRIIELSKGQAILVYRHWHLGPMDVINIFNDNGFDLLQVTRSPDEDYILTISKVRTAPPL